MQATRIIHAYKQAPWRIQRQWVGAFLLAVIGIAMVAALSGCNCACSRCRSRRSRRCALRFSPSRRANADLETRLAKLTSSEEMKRRASALGYRPVQPGELDYIAVPGFVAPEPELLRAAEDVTIPETSLPSMNTRSLARMARWTDQISRPR